MPPTAAGDQIIQGSFSQLRYLSNKKIYIYRVNKKKVLLAAFWPILVIFFQPVMATNIIENFNIFEIF